MKSPLILLRPLLFTTLLVAAATSGNAAPYGPEGLETVWNQADGAKLVLRVFGDEFYARTETRDGFTVVYVPAARSYFYAEQGPDGESIVAGAVQAHLPAPGGLPKHLSEGPDRIRAARLAKIKKHAGDREERWRKRVKAVRKQRDIRDGLLPAPAPGAASQSESAAQEELLAAPVNGAKVGLTILVQFPDDPNTGGTDPTNFPATRTKMERYCNEVGYTDDGNTGSVHDYFADQSLGTLTYTQLVPQIVTLPSARNYYNYSDYPTNATLRDSGAAGRLVITDAIAELEGAGFDFSSLSIDGSNRVLATNVLFAGSTSGTWAKGLWPNSWAMPNPGINVGTGGATRYIYRYQITNIPSSSPVIGTFAHENGHMLLGFPDLYDYGRDSEGVGEHCLMGSGNHNNSGRTPAPLNAYFKDIVGWANVTDYTPTEVSNVSLPTTGNVAYRIRKPGLSSEYFIVENRGSGDQWADSLPDNGIAIWHVDETKYGNNEQQMTVSEHYEVSLEQADGLFDLENDRDRGDGQDLFDSGDGFFTDLTTPDAHWWDGSTSGILIEVTSPVGASMNVQFGDPLPPNTIVVGGPDGGELFYHGFVTDITWDSNTSGNVKIELHKGGSLQTVLAASEANDGTYSWTVSSGLPAGTDYKVRISSVANPSYLDESDADFEIRALPTLADALDTTGLAWTPGGDANWFPQLFTSHDGVDAAENGPIGNNQSSDLQTTLSGPGTLTFWWQVSSEPSFDFLRFYLDGVEQTGSLARISGVVNWVQKSVSIPTGSHIVKWSYTKDGSDSSNLDTAWVDEVVFTPSPKPEIAIEQPVATGLTDGSASIDFGSVILGGDSGALVFTVRNLGTALLGGLSIAKDGADAADFTVGSLGATTLAPGADTTFTVTFAPGAVGARSAAIHIASNDADENPFDIGLAGEGLGIPEIAVEQPVANDLTDGTALIDCGGVNAGGSSGAFVFTVRNPGTASLSGLVITKDGADAADFTVGSLGATTLAPGADTTFTVTLAPASPGTKSAAIHLASNDADENPFDIALTGYGRTAVESWRFTHFGIITNTGNAANLVDSDGDTFLNLMEYAFKMDPTRADLYPVTRAMTAGSVSLTYPRNVAATDVTFTIEESGDLAATIPWTAATVTEEILGTTDGVETVKATRTLLPGDDRLFLRLKLSLNP